MENSTNMTKEDFENAKETKETTPDNTILWNDSQLKMVTRLKLKKDWDKNIFVVVNCSGVTMEGEYCKIELPFKTLPIVGNDRPDIEELIKHAKASHFYAKGKRFLNPDIYSTVI